MTGTILNVATVLVGGSVGLLFGAKLPERTRQTILAGLGLFTAGIGLQMFLQSKNAMIVLGGVLLGGLLGEWWKIEESLQAFGAWLEKRFAPQSLGAQSRSDFIRGFMTASLLFCIGPMTILGSIQDGLSGNYQLLAIKSVLDGFAALAFASTLGIGVLFSTIVILVYQGGISLLAAQLSAVITEAMMGEMTATGGVLIVGLALSSLLEIKPIRVGNFLPALLVTPFIVAILAALGLSN